MLFTQDLAASPRILFTRVNPKRTGERAHLSIPRETRERRDAETGEWVDPRTFKGTVGAYEPMRRSILRAGFEEAGLSEADAVKLDYFDLGVRDFHSRSGKVTKVHYLMARLAPEVELGPPQDASETLLVPVEDLPGLAARENINPEYLTVVEHMLQHFREGKLTSFALAATQPLPPTR